MSSLEALQAAVRTDKQGRTRELDDPVAGADAPHPARTRRQLFLGAAIGGTALVAEAALHATPSVAAPSVVDLTTNQTIGGVKTFTSPPVVPNASLPKSAIAGLVEDLANISLGLPGNYVKPGDPVAPSSLGATAATRYVGGTASGAPTIGGHLVGDYVIDRTGKIWICTVAGTPGSWTATGGPASPLTLSTGANEVPLVISRPTATATKDLFQVIGVERAPGNAAGSYRTIVNRNGGLQTNGAILIQAEVWSGTDFDSPPPMAQSRPICLGIVSDVPGPTFFQRSNGSGAYEEFQNSSQEVVWHLKVAPSSGGSGIFLGIGDDPISALTLSDLHDPANLPALTLRHAGASAFVGQTATAALDISNNFRSGENALAEYALNLNPTGAFVYRASSPGGPRSEIAFFSQSVARINTTSLAINYTDGTSLLMAFEPGSGNIRFRTASTAGGAGVFAIGDCPIPPPSIPAGGGVLYSEGGALKWKGSSGTITTIAAA